jgi:hypothetical protein
MSLWGDRKEWENALNQNIVCNNINGLDAAEYCKFCRQINGINAY